MRRIPEYPTKCNNLYYRVLAKTGTWNYVDYEDYSRKFAIPLDIRRLLNFALRVTLESRNQDDGL